MEKGESRLKITRCAWVNQDPLYIAYHDEEWGKPLYDDRKLFELLMLEGMQAGLSWYTILKKREHYRQVFDGFDPQKIVHYDEAKIEALMQDTGIIRNRLKINAIINNAIVFLQICQEEGSFADYLWSFAGGAPVINEWKSISEVPAVTTQSDQMSKSLKKKGMKFVGSTICYAFMQASGMVDDHTTDCFCHKKIPGSGR
ncbi:DNA-3-methyladenine glycosylase I [Paenibacillus sp. BAC0078]